MKIRKPVVSILLMLIYIIVGSVLITTKQPMGPGNVDWGVLVIGYLGYIYLIAASIYYVKYMK